MQTSEHIFVPLCHLSQKDIVLHHWPHHWKLSASEACELASLREKAASGADCRKQLNSHLYAYFKNFWILFKASLQLI